MATKKSKLWLEKIFTVSKNTTIHILHDPRLLNILKIWIETKKSFWNTLRLNAQRILITQDYTYNFSIQNLESSFKLFTEEVFTKGWLSNNQLRVNIQICITTVK
jgi:hypothetical protein